MSIVDMADPANELTEQIDAGEVDPNEVDVDRFVEDDEAVITRELWDKLPEEKRQEYNAKVARRDEQDIRQEARDLSEEQEEALEALTKETPDTKTVDLGIGDGTEVRTYANEEIEDKMDYIRNNPDLDTIRSTVCEVMGWFIEDEKYGDAEVWREFARIRGIGELKQKFYITAKPYLERADDDEVVRKFRQDR